jgi:hypothetical protein
MPTEDRVLRPINKRMQIRYVNESDYKLYPPINSTVEFHIVKVRVPQLSNQDQYGSLHTFDVLCPLFPDILLANPDPG